MKNLKIINFGLILLLTLLMSIQIVRPIGISEAAPIDLKLTRGDSVKFYFSISTGGSTVKQNCGYSVSGMEPLVVTFEKNEVVIDPEGVANIYGTVSVPADAPIKIYSGMIHANCKPEGAQGGSIIEHNMANFFVVEVVEKPEERVVNKIPEEKREAFPLPLIVIVIILILAIIGYYFSKKSEKKIIS